MSEKSNHEVQSRETSVRDRSSQDAVPLMTELNEARSAFPKSQVSSAEVSKPDELPGVSILEHGQGSALWKSPFVQKTEKPGDGDKNSDRPPTLEERAALAKEIAESIVANGAVPQKILDAMSGKGSNNGVPIRIEEINLMLAERGSKLRLEHGASKEGHDTIAILNNGKIQDKWLIVHSNEFGNLPLNLVKPEVQAPPANLEQLKRLNLDLDRLMNEIQKNIDRRRSHLY